jgi:hypothetical protein
MRLARLELHESTERRVAPRRRLKLDAAGSTQSAAEVDVVVHDLSVTGLLIEAAVDLQTGDRLGVEIPGAGAAEAVVVWRSGNYFGCEFSQRIPKVALSAAALRSAPEPQPLAPPRPRPTPPWQQAPRQDEAGAAPSSENSDVRENHPANPLSPRRKLAILLGLSLGSWALIAVITWLVLAPAWR